MDPRRRRFEQLCQPLRADVYRFAFWLSRNPTVAEDVVQETLLRAWRSIDSLTDDGKARPWLLTIARREHARLYERKRLETVDVDDLAAAEDPALGRSDDQDAFADVRAAILALPGEYREPLVLQVLMGYSTDEIAAHLGLSNGAVLTRLCRARQRLRVAVLGAAREGST
ncbi:MAG TPA: sigma-70 family RNA polymerase sigma factor [Steroidobacteraceae bacterium]|nr:sigma-70 family RNA polymerase sigma factor [Steroidobacteraceae bacterium]